MTTDVEAWTAADLDRLVVLLGEVERDRLHMRDGLEVGLQQVGPQGAVEPDGQQRNVRDRDQEGLGRLSRKGSSDRVGNGSAQHHGDLNAPLLFDLLDREQGRLGVERVKHSFDQQQVGSAVEQVGSTRSHP